MNNHDEADLRSRVARLSLDQKVRLRPTRDRRGRAPRASRLAGQAPLTHLTNIT
jgi:hypothetical protein